MVDDDKLLRIYLNDHLAGSTLGIELARRLAATYRDSPAGDDLARLATEVGDDRQELLKIMRAVGASVQRLKVWAAWTAEKAGRLKLNGHVLDRSPLSGLLELEMLRLGVEGKAAGWRTLRAQADHDDRLDVARLDALLARARTQAETLEKLRTRTADGLFGRS